MSDELRTRIEDALYGRYGYVDVECLNEIMRAITAETPEPPVLPEAEIRNALLDVQHGADIEGCVDAIMRAIAAETPKPKPQGGALAGWDGSPTMPGGGCTCGVGPRGAFGSAASRATCMVHGRPAPKRDTVAELLTEAKRELDNTLEEPSVNNLRNALMSVIRAIEVSIL